MRTIVPPLTLGLLVLWAATACRRLQPAERVKVLPVVFVPTDQSALSAIGSSVVSQASCLDAKTVRRNARRHTFEMAKSTVTTVRGARPLDYRGRPENGTGHGRRIAKALQSFAVRESLRVLPWSPTRDNYRRRRRTINGGLNSGGGVMFLSSFQLHRNKALSNHPAARLGHGFGLPHPDVYGYDLKSIHRSCRTVRPITNGFSRTTPGVFIPRSTGGSLMIASLPVPRSTPNAMFVRGTNYRRRSLPLGPMVLPGLPDFYPRSTDAGEAVPTRSAMPSAVNQANAGLASPTMPDMWHSDKLTKPATLTIRFVRGGANGHRDSLSAQRTRPPRRRHAARCVSGRRFRQVVKQKLSAVDAIVEFPAPPRRLKLTRARKSKILVIRGIR